MNNLKLLKKKHILNNHTLNADLILFIILKYTPFYYYSEQIIYSIFIDYLNCILNNALGASINIYK